MWISWLLNRVNNVKSLRSFFFTSYYCVSVIVYRFLILTYITYNIKWKIGSLISWLGFECYSLSHLIYYKRIYGQNEIFIWYFFLHFLRGFQWKLLTRPCFIVLLGLSGTLRLLVLIWPLLFSIFVYTCVIPKSFTFTISSTS